MAIKDILVHVAVGSAPAHALAAAIEIARTHEARVIGLAIGPTLPAAFYGPDYTPRPLIEQLLAEARDSVAAARARFDAALDRDGLSAHGEWRTAIGEPAAPLALHGRYVDLIVVDQTDPAKEDVAFGLPAELALSSGRPVLAVPAIGFTAPIGRRIVVGWNGSREAARAVADAMPFLTRAERVDVLTVSPRDIGDLPGGDIARHLAAHGVNANVEIREGGLEAGTEMLNFAADRGSDLIVMGCYGHQRMREAIFGGATRTILTQMTVPVLLAH